jgi:CheY-like chemotaxis protein/HPt (histidine-containing phosphotransfer) domain-containing protein
VNDLRERFQARFVAAASDRLRRALAALSTDPPVVNSELHALAGEAAIIGYTEISAAAASGVEIARAWRTTKPTSDQQLQCARILRSLLALVNQLERSAPAPKPAPAAGGRCALVVDDSELVGEELVDALRAVGIEAAVASSTEAAVAAARAKAPDVVLVDANIPGADVRDLCARIREQASLAKFLVVSASSDDDLSRFAREVGADGHIGKLRGTAAIIERVQTLLARGA